MIKQILIFFLCVIITQVHLAPSGCVNLCSEPIGGVGGAGYNNQASESLSAFQTHAAIQQNSALQNFQNLQNQLLHGSQLNLGYVRPGNWSERDQWATDGGAGKVHEERGQLETGNAKVQYYKKNYTASFGTGGGGGGGGGMIIGNSLLGTQNSAGSFNQQNYDQHYMDQNQLLHGSQLNLGYVRPGNWSERDQWATDGGAGKVHEERGQLETGNAKVQYYKKNYTASFGTGGSGGGMIIGNSLLGTQNSAGLFNQQNYDQQSNNLNSAVEDFSGTTHGVQMGNELQTRLHELQSQMDQFNVNFHQHSLPIATTSSFESHMSQLKTRIDQANNQIRQNNNIIQNSHSSNANQNYEFQKNMQQLVKSYENRMQELRRMLDQITQQSQQQTSQVTQPNYHQQLNQYTESVNIPETNIYQQHYDYKSQHKQNNYVPSTQSYVVPSDNLQQSQHYQQQTYVPNDRVTSYPYQQQQPQQQQQQPQAYEQSSLDHQQSQHHGTKNIKRIPIYRNNRYQNYREEAASELDTSNDNLQHSLVNQNAGQTIVPSGSGKRVEEHWSASGHRSETIIPHHVVGDTAVNSQQLFERIRQQPQQQQQQHQQQHRSGSSHYTSGGSSSVYQQSGGQYNTGVLDAGHTPDCDTETQAQYTSRYQRRYRRGIRDGSSRHTDNLNQQTEDFSQQTQQNYQNFNQEHNGRLHHGQHEHDHDHVNRHQGQVEENGDFSQQHQTQSSQHELGSQRHHENTHDRYGGNYHQQQSGNTDFDQHTDSQSRHHHNDNDQDQYDRHDHLEHGGYRHQQTQVSQQEAGQFEFGQQTHSYQQRPGQYALQAENLSQQAQGLGDFTQQQQQQNSSEFTQQSSSHLDFNQNDNSFGARPAPKPTRRGQNSLNYETMDTEVIRPVGVKGGRPKKIQQLQSSNSDASTVIGIENQQQSAGLNWHMGHHPGDLTSDNYQQQNIPELYSQTTGIKPNPLVTLSPLYGNDPWDIREKQDVYSKKDTPLIESSYSTDDVSTTIKPGFWNRISNKITNTYEKAKDKMSDVIG